MESIYGADLIKKFDFEGFMHAPWWVAEMGWFCLVLLISDPVSVRFVKTTTV